MTQLDLHVYADAGAFIETWQDMGYDETEAEQYWALLTELDTGELLIHLPEWLVEQKIGYHEGAIPSAFVGRIEEGSEQAILFVDSAGARKLSQLADRIQSLETSIAQLENKEDTDQERLEWLRRRLDDKRQAFEEREDLPTLAEEWLPTSQIEFIGRRAPNLPENQ